jgi:hypothetical protein
VSDAAQAFKRDRDAGFAVVPGEVHSASVTDTIGICNTALHLLLAQPCSAKAVRTAPHQPESPNLETNETNSARTRDATARWRPMRGRVGSASLAPPQHGGGWAL